MGEDKSKTGQGDSWRQVAMVGTYVVAAVLGYVLGARGLLAFGQTSTSTPLARLGFALREESPRATPAAWAALSTDVEAARLPWKSPKYDVLRDVLDLVVALRGLDSGGNAEWGKAERLCRALGWSRCDRAALEELKRRSRP